MHENHKKEQYFFDEDTLRRLAAFAAVRKLAPYRRVEDVKLLIAVDPAHAGALTGTFAMYGLRPTGFFPSYVTVFS